MNIAKDNMNADFNEDLLAIANQVQAVLDKYDMGNDGSNVLTLIDKLIPSNAQLFESLDSFYNLLEEGRYQDANEVVNKLHKTYPNNVHVTAASTALCLEAPDMH